MFANGIKKTENKKQGHLINFFLLEGRVENAEALVDLSFQIT